MAHQCPKCGKFVSKMQGNVNGFGNIENVTAKCRKCGIVSPTDWIWEDFFPENTSEAILHPDGEVRTIHWNGNETPEERAAILRRNAVEMDRNMNRAIFLGTAIPGVVDNGLGQLINEQRAIDMFANDIPQERPRHFMGLNINVHFTANMVMMLKVVTGEDIHLGDPVELAQDWLTVRRQPYYEEFQFNHNPVIIAEEHGRENGLVRVRFLQNVDHVYPSRE